MGCVKLKSTEPSEKYTPTDTNYIDGEIKTCKGLELFLERTRSFDHAICDEWSG